MTVPFAGIRTRQRGIAKGSGEAAAEAGEDVNVFKILTICSINIPKVSPHTLR